MYYFKIFITLNDKKRVRFMGIKKTITNITNILLQFMGKIKYLKKYNIAQ